MTDRARRGNGLSVRFGEDGGRVGRFSHQSDGERSVVKGSRGQGWRSHRQRRREAACVRAGRTSGQETAKSISIKDQFCKSGGCAMKAVGLTPRDLHCVLRDWGRRKASRPQCRSQQRV